MRWRFIDPINLLEATERNFLINKIDSWWREFQGKTAEISALFSQKVKWDLPEWMEQHLQGINPNLMWEFGPSVVLGNGHRLVITPEANRHLRPLVRAILERAPHLDGWEFYEYRLPENLELTSHTVQGRTGRDITDFKVRASLGTNQLIDLTYTATSIVDQEDQSARNVAFVVTETLLGEQFLDTWIGAIEILPAPRPKGLKALFSRGTTDLPHFIGLDRLQETVKALIGSMQEQLPPNPHCNWVEGSEWTMWELTPEPADDYCEQHDLFVGKSANPPQWVAAHSGRIFCSERFSRCGEKFCYVKMDGSEGFGKDGVADKSAIEDALDAVLKPNKLGCFMGGGTGLRYSYIDLALTDLDRGIRTVRQQLQESKVPLRSWIQFHDSDLTAEWVGIYDDSPEPPMALEL